MKLDSRIPSGAIHEKWENRKFELKLVNPANKRKYKVLVVGSGLAGSSAAASLAELGYQVECFCFQDSPRRAHSIAAQGGINAAKNYRNDGDSVHRLFYDTVKGGDFRAREANVHRLAELSVEHHRPGGRAGRAVRARVLAACSTTAASAVRRCRARSTRAARPASSCCSAPTQALSRQVGLKTVKMFNRAPRCSTWSSSTATPRAIVVRDLLTGRDPQRTPATRSCWRPAATATVFYLSTNAMNCNVTATWRSHKRGAGFANPCYTQIHPTCIPVSGDHQSKLTLMSESLRNDGRIWVPAKKGDKRKAAEIPDNERDYYLERKLPELRQPRPARHRVARGDAGLRRRPRRRRHRPRRLPRLPRQHQAPGQGRHRGARYGNLFQMYAKITGEDPYSQPMRIFPAVHYTMGGLWVDYDLHDDDAGPVRLRRGQLQRPRRQPPRRLGADAGPGRRLLRDPVHDRRLPRRSEAGGGAAEPPRVRQGRPRRYTR